MKKIDLERAISTVANVGVLGGIVFLAIEISQNNEQLAAQTRYNYYQAGIATNANMAQNPEMVALINKATARESLTSIERSRVQLQAAAILRSWEYEYGEYRRGLLTADEYNIEGKKEILRGLKGNLLPQWEGFHTSEEFRHHFENELLAE